MGGIPEITAVLPHRSNLLLVDRIVELVPGDRVVATKAVSYGEVWYRADRGVPQDTAYPCAILLESFNQACALLVMATWTGDGTDVLSAGVPMLGSYTGATVGAPVRPGDVVRHEVSIVRMIEDAIFLTGRSTVDCRTVLSVERGMALRRSAQFLR
jgi:3-hydroxyacyl-[acyl-carrier-protein] dehydratase